MRALIVTTLWPTPQRPASGGFVRDQVQALRAIDGVEVEVFAFPPGGYARAARELRRRHARGGHDLVHAHFGLSAWPALALRGLPHAVTLHGTDWRHPRSRLITRAALPFCDLVAAVSAELAAELPRRDAAILPCGVNLQRFGRRSRPDARRALGLDPSAPCLLFAADPARTAKRFDRARAIAGETPLLTLAGVDPAAVCDHINAANAVLVPSDHEGFGLAVLEALACDVPVLATPVGNHPEALQEVAGTLCAPYDRAVWAAALAPHLEATDPRVDGSRSAARWSAEAMAARVLQAYNELVPLAARVPLPAPVSHEGAAPTHP
jgi:teichuronic acid biosynthesis glycosyltransferase TuaC